MAVVLQPMRLTVTDPADAIAAFRKSDFLRTALAHGMNSFDVRFNPTKPDEAELISHWDGLDAYERFADKVGESGGKETADLGMKLGEARALVADPKRYGRS